MLSEISQTEKDNYCIISPPRGILKNQTHGNGESIGVSQGSGGHRFSLGR